MDTEFPVQVPGKRHRRGDSWVFEYEQLDENGVGENLSGSTWSCQWRSTGESTVVLATATPDVSQAASGIVVFTVHWSAVDPSLQPFSSFEFDVQRTTGLLVETVAVGRDEVVWDVTR